MYSGAKQAREQLSVRSLNRVKDRRDLISIKTTPIGILGQHQFGQLGMTMLQQGRLHRPDEVQSRGR